MNAIEKLRDELSVCGCDPDDCLGCSVPRKVREGLQAVEREYMKRPLDADGVPVGIGDVLTRPIKDSRTTYTVEELKYDGRSWWYACDGDYYACEGASHVKPDPLRELISEAALEIIDLGYQNVPSIGNVPKIIVDEDRLDEWLEVNAERIRDMLGGAE